MATHTLGPWERKSIPGHLFELHDSSGTPVMRIRGGMMPSLEDARLIAAAPELLAELQHLVRLLEPMEDTLQVPGLATLNGARAAIAKAQS